MAPNRINWSPIYAAEDSPDNSNDSDGLDDWDSDSSFDSDDSTDSSSDSDISYPSPSPPPLTPSPSPPQSFDSVNSNSNPILLPITSYEECQDAHSGQLLTPLSVNKNGKYSGKKYEESNKNSDESESTDSCDPVCEILRFLRVMVLIPSSRIFKAMLACY